MSHRDHEHAVGDVVFVVDFNGKPTKRTKVAAIKPYKRGPRVTTADGSEWDVAGGCIWGQRSHQYYTGPRLEPHTDEMEDAFGRVLALSHVRWIERHFADLTPEQQTEIGRVARKVYREARSNG